MVKLPADFRCPHKGCGLKGGYIRLKIEKIKIAKDQSKNKPIWDFTTNSKVGEESVERTQHRHQYKHLSIFGVLHPDKKPVINPPKPKPADKNNELSKNAREIAKRISLCGQMIPFVCQKYPSLEQIAIGFGFTSNILLRNLESLTDYRWKRSRAEWALIAKEARENGPNAASRKYSGITTEGKQEYLSPEHIQQNTPEAEAYWETYKHYFPYYMAYAGIIMNVVSTDPELMEIYKKYENDYDNDRKKEEEDRRQQNQSEQQQEEQKSSNEFYQYEREIFVIRHYDPELRKQQKLEQKLDGKKRKADGKIEHKVKETDLRPEVVEELRRRKAEIKYE